jgi:hypothetical protein
MANQFMWQVHLRQDVLDDAMAELRGLSYEVLRRIVDNPLKKKVSSRDQKTYDLTVTAGWAAAGSEDLEIEVRLKRGWFGKTTTDGFRVTAPPSGLAPSPDAAEADSPHSNPETP